ncbi:hypothetical protein PYCC9005_005263 [Savitreella phatthalungensis]
MPRRVARILLPLILSLCLGAVRARSLLHSHDALDNVEAVQRPELTVQQRWPSKELYARLSFSISAGEVQLELAQNHDLVEYTNFQLQRLDGTTARLDFDGARDLLVLRGTTIMDVGHELRHVGRARIVVHRRQPLSFDGTFAIDGVVHHIELLSNYERFKRSADASVEGDPAKPLDAQMVVWRDTDERPKLLKRAGSGWLLEGETYESASMCSPRASRGDLVRRQLRGDTGQSYVTQEQLARTIGQTQGCPSQRMVALVGAAADCNFVSAFNSTGAARASIISAFNSASQVFESSFNISLGLASVLISDEGECPTIGSAAAPWNTACDGATDIGNRLNTFSAWRSNQRDSHAAWTLLTTCATGSEIGVAWLGTLCDRNSTAQQGSTVSSTNVVAAISRSYWRTLAHEIGHNFGANHDCTSQLCDTSIPCCPLSTTTCSSSGQYLMNPSSSQSSSGFSPCTVGQICSNILRRTLDTSCLTTNQNVQLDGAATCGNGVVEAGEDCDCGGSSGCGNNPCCDPTTCRFKAGAVCDFENSACCTTSCQFASNATVCRPSTGICDPQELCTGSNATCPADQTLPNGRSCGNGLTCASGACTSRDLQCRQLMNGSSGACDDFSCALTCRIGGQCFVANQYFAPGTSCGNNGQCRQGSCDQGSLGNQIDGWFARNKNWLIPVVSIVGGLIVLTILWSLIASCISKRKSAERRTAGQHAIGSRPEIPQQRTYVERNNWYAPPRYPSAAHLTFTGNTVDHNRG